MGRLHPSVPHYSAGPAPLTPDAAAPPPPEDRWEPLTELGLGGMGKVHLVRDRWLDREVALKTPLTPAAAAALAREARITARLEHPGIVPIYDVHPGPDGALRYAMPVLRGASLADHLALATTPDDRLRLLRPLLAACEAIAYAHAQGVIHRDLSASNVMLGAFGEVRIIDWGLALTADDAPSAAPPPRAGTPGAMSPEQERGAPLDARSDVWSLGALLRLIAADHAPPPLAALIAKATAPAPADRYPGAADLAHDLANFLEGRRVAAHAYTGLELLSRLARAWRTPLLVAAAALVVVAALAIASYDRVVSARAEAEDRFAHALVAQAAQAARSERTPEAAILAAHAFARAPRPAARGLLALSSATPPPHRVPLQAPPCAPVDVAPDGAVLCLDDGAVTLAAAGAPRWRLPGRAATAAFIADGAAVAVFASDTVRRYRATDGAPVGPPASAPHRNGAASTPGGRHALALGGPELTLVGPTTTATLLPPCHPAAVNAAALDPTGQRWAVVCADGALLVGDVASPAAPTHRLDPDLGRPPDAPSVRALALLPGDLALTGDDAGRLRLFSLGTPATQRSLTLPGRPFVRALLPFPDAPLVAVLLDDRPPSSSALPRSPSSLSSPTTPSAPCGPSRAAPSSPPAAPSPAGPSPTPRRLASASPPASPTSPSLPTRRASPSPTAPRSPSSTPRVAPPLPPSAGRTASSAPSTSAPTVSSSRPASATAASSRSPPAPRCAPWPPSRAPRPSAAWSPWAATTPSSCATAASSSASAPRPPLPRPSRTASRSSSRTPTTSASRP